jgi:hypothetical protein
MTQIRQAKIFWLEETKEYQVKLFINDKEQKSIDCFVDTLNEARDEARRIERGREIEKDFCKEEMKKHCKNKIIKHEYPIYNIQTSEVIGWIELDEKESLPQAITIRNKTYKKE